MSQVTLFEHILFRGAHKHVFDYESNLAAPDDSFFNDRASSAVVESGEWSFYRHTGYNDRYPLTLGPGEYPRLPDMLVQNDDMSSLAANYSTGPQESAHVILFEHAGFRGAHKHVYMPEPNLGAPEDSSFNDRFSSAVVLAGSWRFYRHAGYVERYAPTLGPGAYPRTFDLGIQNDDASSLRPTDIGPVAALPHVILFEHANLRGRHKHVFAAEPNLAAAEDNFFNDRISSIVVLSGTWAFYRHSNFVSQYPGTLGPGIYRWVGDLGFANDDMSSLRPV